MTYKRTMFVMTFVFTLISSVVFAAKDYMGVGIPDNEDGASPVVTKYKIDMDGDGKKDDVRILYGPGVSDKSLNIEVRKDNKLIDTLKPIAGIQPNYRIADIDKDGKMEVMIWGGLWDPRLPGEDDVTEDTYEGHSDLHRYVVVTYKLVRGEYYLWDVYTTKKKYDPFCEEQPLKD
jgi:hypothetical protein